ncbi:hypothetical protein EUX98_g1929 [Antrodiella citrinella]|uniref:PX domain-containing protein n=1 Tax=Antrodiella citrinella TaxID=2447956 RepID=A0A4S4N062_9APHY|nr:hypothetical protein EUX98_g1929 [Antrodiella citrinella]
MTFRNDTLPDSNPGTGTTGGISTEFIMRAVVQPAPRIFSATVIPPTKIGGHFCFGVHVCAIDGRLSTYSGSSKEYDLWRRWEDCLWFQELLEYEYSLMARSKRDRLAAGKGIKKNGIYIHSDLASSFDSLPPGPEASSVAMDVHAYIPKMNKKGTIFRASLATIEQRGREFKALVEGLLDEDVPTLVKELREIRVVRDFFGIWRRDTEIVRKEAEALKRASVVRGKSRGSIGSRASITSSAFSLYFSSPSSTSISGVQSDSEASPSRSRSGSEVSASSPSSLRSMRTPATAPMAFIVSEAGLLKSPSPSSSSHGSLRRTPTARTRQSVAASSIAPSTLSSNSGVPIMFVSGDERIQARMTIDKHPGLQSLPEDEELPETASASSPGVHHHSSPMRRLRGWSATECAAPRIGPDVPDVVLRGSSSTLDTEFSFNNHPQQYYNAPMMEIQKTSGPGSSSSKRSSVELSSFSDRSSRRLSNESVTSFASNPSSAPNDSSSDFDKDCSPTPGRPSYLRDSFATVDSFIASSVMESMLPRRADSPTTPGCRSFSVGDRTSRVPSDGAPWDERDDIMAAYFYDPALRAEAEAAVHEDVPEQHRVESMISTVSISDSYPKVYQHRPPGQPHLPWNPQNESIPEDSVSYATGPASPISPIESPIFPTTFTIKAVKEDAIILLRADATMMWKDIRAKISEKFEAQEGSPLTKSFLIGYVPSTPANVAIQQPNSRADRGRPRASSTSSVGLLQARGGMRTINSDEEWQKVIAGSNGKLALRILDRF